MNQALDKQSTLLIWDAEDEPPKGKWVTLLWRSYGCGDNDNDQRIYSLPRIVEEQADQLRQRYLTWIYDLGENLIDGHRLVDHLELRPGFSYWWMTLIAEKCNAYKSFQIVDALKLLALDSLITRQAMTKVVLVSRKKNLAQSVHSWCEKARFSFEWRPLRGRREADSWIKRTYHALPQPVQASILLARYVAQRWPLKQQKVPPDSGESVNELTLVDYLIHLDQKALTSGRFESNIWTGLAGILGLAGGKINWLHHYIQHEAISSASQAREFIARFNQSGTGRQFHACLDSALSLAVVMAAVIDYLSLVRRSFRLDKIRRRFVPAASRLDFWPLFQEDWLNSLRGPAAIWNCLCLNLLERTIGNLPRQKMGIYLQENQAWEMALIHVWRVAGHGPLIGVPHATVRNWDLRYFYDPLTYQRTGKRDFPLPDKSALNGPAAMAAYRKGGYPEEQLVEVEALRYLYLADRRAVQTGARATKTGPLRILVLGDYLSAVTVQQMQWLASAAPLLSPETRYVVKSHPNCPIKTEEYPSLRLLPATAPLLELLADCDAVYTSNITSAAVDAYCQGVPVVTMLDGNTFNMSPLRSMEGVMYVTTPAELARALRASRNCVRVAAHPYFCLDKRLSRWRKLLGLGPVDNRDSGDK